MIFSTLLKWSCWGSNPIVGQFAGTRNGAVALSFVEPTACTVWLFVCALAGTVKLAVKTPLLAEVVELTCVASKLIVMDSDPVKPVPFTVTVDDGAPDAGESVMSGLAAWAAIRILTIRPSPRARITRSESVALTSNRDDKRIAQPHFPNVTTSFLYLLITDLNNT